MTEPIDRLRSTDPARDLGAQPDERAEADLRLLLAEPPRAVPAVSRPERRRLAPILVTAIVALAVIALTATVLGAVHPRTVVGGQTPTITPTLGSAACHPAQVLPFQCGTYQSTYGGKAITGNAGGPAKDPLSISFTAQQGALLLTAATKHCFGARVLVRFDGKRLIRIGAVEYSQAGCWGLVPNRKSWAYAFLNGPLLTTDGQTYSLADDAHAVFFEYQGAAPLGEQQLPRNDTTCVAAHVAPFSCATYFSAGGTGSLGFLGTTLFSLHFQHMNGQLTAALYGRCNSMGVPLQPDGNTVVAGGISSTAMGCLNSAGAHDNAISTFFAGTLTYRIDGSLLTFRSGTSTAVFSSAIGACRPVRASSPFCGTSTATGGSGSLGFLAGQYRMTFSESGSGLIATIVGQCSTTRYTVTVDWTALRFRRDAVLAVHSCPAGANAHDLALAALLTEGTVFRWDGTRLTLDRAASGAFFSAVFTRS